MPPKKICELFGPLVLGKIAIDAHMMEAESNESVSQWEACIQQGVCENELYFNAIDPNSAVERGIINAIRDSAADIQDSCLPRLASNRSVDHVVITSPKLD